MLTLAIIAVAIAVIEFWMLMVLVDKYDAMQERQTEQTWAEIFDEERKRR